MTFTPDRGIEIRTGKALLEKPELAAHLSTITSLWAQMVTLLEEILGLLAGVDAITAMRLYTAIENDGAKQAMLRALAEDKLPDNLQAELNAIFKWIREHGSSRNVVAHGVWGVSPQYPDALFYTDVREWLNWRGTVNFAEHSLDAIHLMEIMRRWPDAVGYRKDDFERTENEILKMIDRVEVFRRDVDSFLSP